MHSTKWFETTKAKIEVVLRTLVLPAALLAAGCGQRAPEAREQIAASTQALVRASQVWLPACGSGRCSTFKTSLNWFDSDTRDRVWLADVTGPDPALGATADIVGIAFNGDVLVAAGSGTDFGTPTLKIASSVFTTTAGFFTNGYRQRVWVTDVTGPDADGVRRADIVGIADDGRIFLYKATQTGFAGPTSSTSPFAPSGGWFDAPGGANADSNQRVWLADVTGDGVKDFVGVGFAGDVWISPATGNGFGAAIGPIASSFRSSAGWFNGATRDRVWVADYVGGPEADILGIATNGDVYVSQGKPGGGFRATAVVAHTAFDSSASPAGIGWFDTAYQSRIFATQDVSGDGKADVVGVAPPGKGDGDIWVLRSIPGGFVQKVWLFDSKFKTAPADNDWFSLLSHPRLWLTDVTGDGRADLVGVNAAGEVWAAKADSAAASAPGSTTKSYYFQPSVMVAQSALGAYFDPAKKQRVWPADVTGDGVSDLVAISPPGVSNPDGSVIWTQAFPTHVTDISSLTRGALAGGGTINLQVSFSRRVSCASDKMPASALEVFEKIEPNAETLRGAVAATQPSGPTFSCNFARSFPVAGSADVRVRKEFNGLAARDRWNQEIDGNGNGFRDTVDRALRADYLYGKLTAGVSKASVPLPAANGDKPSEFGPPCCHVDPSDANSACYAVPTPMARAIVMGNAEKVVAFVELELIGVNPARLRDLIKARTGILGENIFISATHAHGVPWTLNLYVAAGFDDRSFTGRPFSQPAADSYAYTPPYPYLQWIEDRAADQVAKAYAAMVPAQLGAGSTAIGGVAAEHNRWYQSQVASQLCDSAHAHENLDPAMGVIALKTATGSPLALIMNYAEHAVTLAPSYCMSADFPSFASKYVEDAGYGVGMFINGGAGDINPADVFVSNAAVPDTYGQILASSALSLAAQPGFVGDTTGMRIASVRDVHELNAPSSCNAICTLSDPSALRPDGTPVSQELESTSLVVTRPGAQKPERVFSLASIPGEIFVKGQLDLKQAVPGNTFLFGYTNGYYGYFPDTQARQCALDLSIPNDPNSCRLMVPPSCDDPNPPNFGPHEPLCYSGYTCADSSGRFQTAVFMTDAPGGGVPGEYMVATAANRILTMAP